MAGGDITPIVIMCGGRGERLHPLTHHKPKPLLEVGRKPILESIIDGFIKQGFKTFYLCVNYKADLIKEYFGDGSSKGARIRYIHEDVPMGTGGALKLLPSIDIPFIVTNADILAYNIEYGKIMEHHARAGELATICLGLHQRQIDYGVATVEDGRLVALDEKPIESWQVSAGIYVLEPKALELAPDRLRWDMPDLLQALTPSVAVYALQNYWIDVGRIEDLAVAHARAMQ